MAQKQQKGTTGKAAVRGKEQQGATAEQNSRESSGRRSRNNQQAGSSSREEKRGQVGSSTVTTPRLGLRLAVIQNPPIFEISRRGREWRRRAGGESRREEEKGGGEREVGGEEDGRVLDDSKSGAE